MITFVFFIYFDCFGANADGLAIDLDRKLRWLISTKVRTFPPDPASFAGFLLVSAFFEEDFFFSLDCSGLTCFGSVFLA
jgi:hypothetical protein